MIGDLSLTQDHRRHGDGKRFERPNYVKTYWQLHRFLREGSSQHQVVRTVPPAVGELSHFPLASTAVVEASPTGGAAAAQRYLNANGLGRFKVDAELTTRETLVAVDPATGEVRIGLRGTQIPTGVRQLPDTVADVRQDLRVIRGQSNVNEAYEPTFRTVDETFARYGRVDEVVGYSLGGNRALAVARRFPQVKQVDLFNPLIGARDVSLAMTDPSVSQRVTIHRTSEDYASGPARSIERLTGVSVAGQTIDYAENPAIGNPHALEHFNGTAARGGGDHAHTVASNNFKAAMQDHGKLLTVDMMRSYVDQQLSFTDFVSVNDKGLNDPRLALAEDPRVAMWMLAGGSLTPAEENVLGTNGDVLPYLPEEDMSLLADFSTLDQPDRLQILRESKATVDQTAAALDAVAPHNAEVLPETLAMADVVRAGGEPSLGWSAARSGAGLATGVASGALASLAISKIPGSENQPAALRDTETGALAGLISAGGGAALGGSVLTIAAVPEIAAGAAGFAAGGATARAVDRAAERGGIKQHELLADATGGAVGGAAAAATTAAVGIGASTLAGFEAGEAIGIAGGPLGLLAGGVIGTVAGATIGVGAWLVSRIFPHKE